MEPVKKEVGETWGGGGESNFWRDSGGRPTLTKRFVL